MDEQNNREVEIKKNFFDHNPPKTNFFLGLSIGVAVVSLIGFIILMMAIGLNGNNSKSAVANIDNTNQVDNTDQKVANVNSNPVAEEEPTPTAPNLTGNEIILGDKNAPITVISFTDFQCPYCSRWHETMAKIVKDFPGKVKWVYKHFPLESIHPYAMQSSESVECAGEQGKYWEFVNEIFANQDKFNAEYFNTAAKKIGLNVNKFKTCVSEGKYKEKVKADQQTGLDIGIRGTPGNFVGGYYLPGAQPYETVAQIINGNK